MGKGQSGRERGLAVNYNDLETVLMQLTEYGKPSVVKMTDGWWCRVELEGFSKGTSFEVRSELDSATPLAAAMQALERIKDTLAAIKGAA